MIEGSMENQMYRRLNAVPIKTTNAMDKEHDPTAREPFKPPSEHYSYAAVGPEAYNKLDGQAKDFLKRYGVNDAREFANYFRQISGEHGRAMVDERINNNVIWGDKFDGILYAAKDWKGTNMEDVEVGRDVFSPYRSQLRVRGLKDVVGIARINEVSRIMRKNGLPTELPVRIRKLEELVLPSGDKISVKDWKEQKLGYLRKQITELEEQGKYTGGVRERLDKMQYYFNQTDFYEIERNLQVAERISDLKHVETKEDFEKFMEPIFKTLNTVFKVKGRGFIPKTPKVNPEKDCFDVSKTEDLERFFNEYLPVQMGVYLGRMHKIGLVHGYPHTQNWSLVGTLYDLDSVSGSPLGDSAPLPKDYEEDLTTTKLVIYSLTVAEIGKLFEKIGITVNESTATDFFTKAYNKELHGE